MRTSIMIRVLSLGMICLLAFHSCKDEETDIVPKFLDVNIRFNGAVKPQMGSTLLLNLYYKDMTGISYDMGVPDEQLEVVLTEDQITQGMRLTFDGFSESAEIAQVFAFVDLDGDGVLSDGDLAGYYNDKTLSGVESGEEQPDNVIAEYAITFNVNQLNGQIIGEKLTDIDGNEYETVFIGEREWMKENLRVTRYRNGDAIPTGLSNTEWSNTTAGAYAVYPHADVDWINSEEEMVESYGLLYNWYAADHQAGICPEGWRVATDDDWLNLEMAIGMAPEEAAVVNQWRGDHAHLLKSTTGWTEVEGVERATDEFGFSMVPAGLRQPGGTFVNIGRLSYFWTSTASTTTPGRAIRRVVRNTTNNIQRGNIDSREGYCIRCVRIP
ncbi:fibrobacter succinogenes major paralogous domain-containing protein [Sphingobacterium haloxyli]|uniref:EF-hand domain-containing protein n=1 Tax=Sphingobacterium haloxyli TaxID=2100533 RepID=A0A2S9IYA3_9SPHI|nr:fibrobacter succinogenes major paralogous domain-containing protein [Sphingobacterium haloxyli]PRD45505.1 hypothetical protein C5745_18110 [Sphingobacterium haloxyli]